MVRSTPGAACFSCIVLCNAAALAAATLVYPHYGNASTEAGAGVAGGSRLEYMLSSLAEQACLFVMKNSTVTELDQCTSNFLAPLGPHNHDGISWRPCRGENTITVPGREDDSGEYRIAIVEDTTNITREIFISIQRSNESSMFNSTSPKATYNLWVVTFDSSGRRFGAWEMHVLRPRLHPLPVREFQPPTQFHFEDDGLMADMSWNMTDDYNCDYSASYVCGHAQPFDSSVDTSAGYPQSLSAHYLPFSTTCHVTVISLLGEREAKAVFHFTTPSCQRVRGPELCPPERPSTVRAEAIPSGTLTASGEHAYTVKVQWAAPEYPPQSYTVVVQSVHGNYTASLQVDGNATEALLENAELSGYYHVQVTAVSQSAVSKSKVLEELALPPKEVRWRREAAWATAACCVAALMVVMVLWWWRRVRVQHRLRRHHYFQELEQNAPKEMSLESELVYPADAFELRSDRVVLFEVLGEGAFGVVRKGWIPDKSKEVAVKMLKESPTAEDVRQFRQEMEVMKSVGAHAHVVSLLGCVTTAHNMMIVVEYCARGDLLNYLRSAWEALASKRLKLKNQQQKLVDQDNYIAKNGSNAPDVTLHNNLAVNKLYDLQGVDLDLTTVDLLSFCRQIAMGMEFLSSNKVVHRDLAARNILVCADKTVKIADFGLSRDVYRDNQYRKTTNGKLPIKWMALESLTHQIYTTQSDVWSFGIVVWETVTLGGVPYPGMSAAELPARLRDGYRMPRPYNCAPKLYKLMCSCWQEVPQNRPTFIELHEQLDSLLGEASHLEYLEPSEEWEEVAQHKVPPDKFFKYWKFIYRDGKSASESSSGLSFYQKHIYPLKQARSHHALLNHYSGTPTHYTPSTCSVQDDSTTKSLVT